MTNPAPEKKPLFTKKARGILVFLLGLLAGVASRALPAPWDDVVEVVAPAVIEEVKDIPVRDEAPVAPVEPAVTPEMPLH